MKLCKYNSKQNKNKKYFFLVDICNFSSSVNSNQSHNGPGHLIDNWLYYEMYYHPFVTTVFENVDEIIEIEVMIPSIFIQIRYFRVSCLST